MFLSFCSIFKKKIFQDENKDLKKESQLCLIFSSVFNSPTTTAAVVNVLLLRHTDITILTVSRSTMPFENESHIVDDYALFQSLAEKCQSLVTVLK